jgi:hypothetical protein
MAKIKKKAGLGSVLGGLAGGALGFLGGRAIDRRNQREKDATVQMPAKHGKKVVKKMQEGGKVKDSWLAKTVGKRSKLDDYKDSAAKWVSKKTGIAESSSPKSYIKKAGTGGSFPDLNKDGKITRADILKGRGVIAKSGKKMSKKK